MESFYLPVTGGWPLSQYSTRLVRREESGAQKHLPTSASDIRGVNISDYYSCFPVHTTRKHFPRYCEDQSQLLALSVSRRRPPCASAALGSYCPWLVHSYLNDWALEPSSSGGGHQFKQVFISTGSTQGDQEMNIHGVLLGAKRSFNPHSLI